MLIRITTTHVHGQHVTREMTFRSKAFVDKLVDDSMADPKIAAFDLKVWNTRKGAGLVKVDGQLVPTEGPDYHAAKHSDGTFTSFTKIGR